MCWLNTFEQWIWYKIIVSAEALKNWWTPKIFFIRPEKQGKGRWELINYTLINWWIQAKYKIQCQLNCFNPILYESWWCSAGQIIGMLPQRQTFIEASVKLSWWWQSSLKMENACGWVLKQSLLETEERDQTRASFSLKWKCLLETACSMSFPSHILYSQNPCLSSVWFTLQQSLHIYCCPYGQCDSEEQLIPWNSMNFAFFFLILFMCPVTKKQSFGVS